MKQESWKRLLPWSRTDPPAARNLRLQGRLTVLRDKRREDVEADYRWRVEPELAALDATAPIRLSLEEYTRYFFDELEYPSPWSVRLAIESLDGRHIGNIMYYDIDHRKRQAELGVMVGDRDYWDRGCGSDAVQSLLLHVFQDTDLDRVYLHTLTSNDRARAAFRKSGFQEIRPVRRDGNDFVLMEVWRDRWLREVGDARAAELAPDGTAPAGDTPSPDTDSAS